MWICACCLKEFHSARPSPYRLRYLSESSQWQYVCDECQRLSWQEVESRVTRHGPMVLEMMRAREKFNEL